MIKNSRAPERTRIKKYGLLLALGAVIFVCHAYQSQVRAATSGQTVNVGMTVAAPTQTTETGSSGRGVSSAPVLTDAAPTISAVNFVLAPTMVTVAWSASDDNGLKSSKFEYGLTTNYGQGAIITGAFKVSLSSLVTSTVYFFKITVTDTANQITINTGSFKTSAGPVAALPLISSVAVLVDTTSATISWLTDIDTTSEINYGATADYGSKVLDATLAATHKLIIKGLQPNTAYHYRLIATDANGNSQSVADAIFTTHKEALPPPDVSQLRAIPVGQSIVINWTNPTSAAAPDFKEVKVVKKIGSRPTSLSDGALIYTGFAEEIIDPEVSPNIKYYYSIFSVDTSGNTSAGTFTSAELPPPPGQEICGNNKDDDANGKADCADKACVLSTFCLPKEPVPTPEKPATETPTPENPGSAASTTVFARAKISLDQVQFLAANRLIPLTLQGITIYNLNGFNLSVALPDNILLKKPASITIAITGQGMYQLRYEASAQRYISDLVVPAPGEYRSFIIIDYGTSEIESLAFTLASLPWGQVTADGIPLSNVIVKLLSADGSPVAMESYGQPSEFTTKQNGQYGWVLPAGKYFAKFYLAEYYEFSTSLIATQNNIFNESIQLVAKPPKLSEVIDLDKPLQENLKNIAKNLSAKGKATFKLLQNLSNDPLIQKAAETVVAPAAVSVVAVSSGAFIPWGDIWPLLKLLFLQPILLIGKRKRESWGQVYHSLTKLPVDLAIVRLLDNATGKVVQSRVTDKNGRYYFTTTPGNYRLEVVKDKMSFPSKLLKNFNEDGRRVDIYHGEQVIVNEKYPAITANVPLDPAGEVKPPSRLRLEKIGRRAQALLSSLGLIATAVSFYISPKWYVGALLVGHLAITFIFRRLARPAKPKSWGIVYDIANQKPIGRVIARLFSAQFNKMISTQITDGKGRYYFLAGDNRFYVTYEHKDYQSNKTNEIDLSGKEIDTIRDNIALIKKTNPNPASNDVPRPESGKTGK